MFYNWVSLHTRMSMKEFSVNTECTEWKSHLLDNNLTPFVTGVG